jgi:hypothetical protein
MDTPYVRQRSRKCDVLKYQGLKYCMYLCTELNKGISRTTISTYFRHNMLFDMRLACTSLAIIIYIKEK